ncbi:nitrogen regulation protein NR(II) [Galenea microaerophila]
MPHKSTALTTKQQLELLESLNGAVIWLDQQTRIRYLNIAASELLQISSRQAQGVLWRSVVPNLFPEIESIRDEKLTVHEYTLQRPDASKLRISATIVPCELEDQPGWLLELFNIERHQQITEEDERWHQYEAGNMLVKTLAHEVKNPLAGIYGAAQLLEKQLQKQSQPQAEKTVRFTQVILKEVQRLENLVNRMLGPELNMEKQPENIHYLIRYVLEVLESSKPKNVAIKLDYDASIPEIEIAFEPMVQALMNIILNAYQAMEKHGGILTIQTRVERKFTLGNATHPLVAVISITDEGEGIPPEMFDSIFYPMVTSKKAGTGLGLPVSQNIVRAHDGLIVASSEPGETCFKIYLPLGVTK